MHLATGRVRLAVLVCLASGVLFAQGNEQFKSFHKIPAGAKIYIAPMAGGFDTYVTAGIQKKDVPLVVVTDRAKAEYEMTGISESDKAGWAKMLFAGSQQSNEHATVKVTDLKKDEVVFAYSVDKVNSVRGRQSAGEACAKHLKQQIE
jgi:hypothetical protein